MIRRRSLTFAVLAAVPLSATLAAGQASSLNRVGDGGFEAGGVSLTLTDVERFPWFSGGWASRGPRPPEAIADDTGRGFTLSLRSLPTDPAYVFQDVPLIGSGFEFRLAFRVDGGTQSVRLLSEWDRRDPAGGTAAFEATISRGELTLATPAGIWRFPVRWTAGTWHELHVRADPRQSTQMVAVDGGNAFSLPGVAARGPRTIVLGGVIGQGGSFRYDDVELYSLIDLELAGLRDAAQELDGGVGAAFSRRLDAAGIALARDASILALPELAVARNLLRRVGPGDQRELLGRIEGLIELIESGVGGRGRRRQF